MLQQVTSFSDFVKCVKRHKWTVSQVRCDEPPPPELLDLMDTLGLSTYEQYVLRYVRQAVS